MNYKKMSKAELINELESLKSRLEVVGISGKSKDITERKKIEETLQKSEERLSLALNGAQLGMWDWNIKTGEVHFSRQWAEILGYSPGEIIPHVSAWEQLVHPDDKSRVMDMLNANLEGKTSFYECEHRLLAKSGKWIWIQARGQIVERNDDNKPLRHAGTYLVINDRKQAEEEIKRLAKFPSENPNPVMRVFNDGNILYHNKASTFLLDTWGCRTTKILPDNYMKIVSEVLHSGLSRVTETECSRGRVISLTFAPVIEEGYVNIYGMDITERKQMEEKLNKTILRTALDGFWIIDIQGRILEVNDAYCNLIGYSREELLKMEISDVEALERPEVTRKHIQQIIKAGGDRFESKHRGKDGRVIDIEVSTNYLNIKGGRIFSFIRDVTDRKRAEEKLHEQKKALEQKNIALSEILGQIEIEKKQIKDNVIANAETLLLPVIQKLKLTGESRKYVQLLQKNLEELTSSFGTKLTEKRVKLTSREIEICNMIKNGLTNKEIARLLSISPPTIERHRANIRKKLGIVKKEINLSSFLNTF